MDTLFYMRELKAQGISGNRYRQALQQHKEAREASQEQERRELALLAAERARQQAEARQRAEQIAANEAAIKAITQPTDPLAQAIRAKIEQGRTPRG
jgi:hypothetical protein